MSEAILSAASRFALVSAPVRAEKLGNGHINATYLVQCEDGSQYVLQRINDRQAGGYTTIRTGQAQDANAILIPKQDADEAMDCASCIGCGACVAACKNGSAMLFVSSKVSQLALLPQGRPEAAKRAKAMVAKMDELGFGNCTNTRACEAVCPKNETIANIARLNREFIKAKLAD